MTGLLLAGCSAAGGAPPAASPSRIDGSGAPVLVPPADEPTPRTSAPSPSTPTPSTPIPSAPSPSTPSPSSTEPQLDLGDRAAGLTSDVVPETGPGTTTVVAGSTQGTGNGRLVRLRVEVEDGLPVDGEAFAAFVMATLSDPRGWGREGWDFVRTDAEADAVLTLASPQTSAERCAPLDTRGELSCRNGEAVVLTLRRWTLGAPAYGGDRTSYRQYLVSHEVGHYIGKGHAACPGPGEPAPTMMQQTKGVGACAAQPWPYPGEPVTSTG